MDNRYLHLKDATNGIISQLVSSLELLDNEAYNKSLTILFNATIGQHVRHIIELFIELEKGLLSGNVNYDKRERDYSIESNKEYAILLLTGIANNISSKNIVLNLEASYMSDSELPIKIETNYFRELAYNIEHAIHHMALIRIGFSFSSNIELSNDFGVASSTLKYRNICAQ